MKNAKEADKETTEKLINFAKDAGYDITLDEMKEFFRELAESKEGALTDTELDMVAGGKSEGGIAMVVLSVLTVGLICSIASTVAQFQREGGCGEVFK